jgi:hypothetical protein
MADLLSCGRYVERNPLAAGLAKQSLGLAVVERRRPDAWRAQSSP